MKIYVFLVLFMKKAVNLFLLAHLCLACGIIAVSTEKANAEEVNVVKQQEVEKKEETVTSRRIISIGFSKQTYTGKYSDLTKDAFFKEVDGNLEPVEVKETRGAFIAIDYDFQLNLMRLLNPYVGIGANLGVPMSKQNNTSGFRSYTGNFADIKIKLGNSFKIVKGFLDINVYVMAGLGSSVYYGQIIGSVNDDMEDYGNLGSGFGFDFSVNVLGAGYESREGGSRPEFGFSYGYIYGVGGDITIAEHLSVGCFWEIREMKHGQDNGNISDYKNNTIGLRIGFAF